MPYWTTLTPQSCSTAGSLMSKLCVKVPHDAFCFTILNWRLNDLISNMPIKLYHLKTVHYYLRKQLKIKNKKAYSTFWIMTPWALYLDTIPSKVILDEEGCVKLSNCDLIRVSRGWYNLVQQFRGCPFPYLSDHSS